MSPASANEAAFQESKRQNTYLLHTQIVEALVHTIGTYQAITIMSLVMEFPNPMLRLSRGPRHSSAPWPICTGVRREAPQPQRVNI